MKWLSLLFLSFILTGCTPEGGLSLGASQSGLPQWKATTTDAVGGGIGNAITPRTNQRVYINGSATSTGSFTFTSYQSCNLDTDSNGLLVCGADASGGGGGSGSIATSSAAIVMSVPYSTTAGQTPEEVSFDADFKWEAALNKLSATNIAATNATSTTLVVSGNATTTGRLVAGGTATNNFADLWVAGDSYTSGSATTTGVLESLQYATTTGGLFTMGNAHIGGTFNLFNILGNSWDDFCVSITGHSGLCDGNDASGAGGNDGNFAQNTTTNTVGANLIPTTNTWKTPTGTPALYLPSDLSVQGNSTTTGTVFTNTINAVDDQLNITGRDDVNVVGGNSTLGTGGDINLTGGDSNSSSGSTGGVFVNTGYGTAGNAPGGDFYTYLGIGNGSGRNGLFKIINGDTLFDSFFSDSAGNASTSNSFNIGTTLNTIALGAGDLFVGRNATTSGNLTFMGELMPDGSTCANGQILKKTGANDWDCAADAGGGDGGGFQLITGNTLTPTSTAAGLLINAASSTITNLISNSATSSVHAFGADGAGDSIIEFYDTNVLSYYMGVDDSANQFVIATSSGFGVNDAFTISSLGNATATAHLALTRLTQATGGTNNDLCINSNNEVVEETTGVCVVSSAKFKHDIFPLTISGLDIINQLQPSTFKRNGEDIVRYGFVAEQVAEVDEHLATYGIDGLPRGLDDHALIASLVKAVQELQDKNLPNFDYGWLGLFGLLGLLMRRK